MKATYFNTRSRLDALTDAAINWHGTPWVQNSSARHVGVSCHNLPRALYIESGALTEDFPMMQSTPAESTALNAMELFIDGRPEFARLRNPEGGPVPLLFLQPGDLIGMFIRIDSVGRRLRQRCVNHLGVLLRANRFSHVLIKKNTDEDLINVPPWSQIQVAAWRPMER